MKFSEILTSTSTQNARGWYASKTNTHPAPAGCTFRDSVIIPWMQPIYKCYWTCLNLLNTGSCHSFLSMSRSLHLHLHPPVTTLRVFSKPRITSARGMHFPWKIINMYPNEIYRHPLACITPREADREKEWNAFDVELKRRRAHSVGCALINN